VLLVQPTSEMFEEQVTVTTTETQKLNSGTASPNPNSGNKWSQF
jgi:hypothetical protein